MEVINLTYNSTNCYLIESEAGFIMIDAGWPNTLPQFLHLLKQKDIHANEIKYILVTHFHPDHAGLVQDIKNFGAKFILHSCQVSYMSEFKKHFKPKQNFKNIEPANNIIVTSEESRALLKKMEIKGEIIKTPGHSDDSISLIIDDSCAFTGDLTNITLISDEPSEMKDSWMKIKSFGVKEIYPGHGNSFDLLSYV